MAKRDRNQTRKMFARELKCAIRENGKQSGKTLTPEVLAERFAHIIRNPADSDAANRYSKNMADALTTKTGVALVQLKQILKQQVTAVHAYAYPEIEVATTATMRRLFKALNKLKRQVGA